MTHKHACYWLAGGVLAGGFCGAPKAQAFVPFSGQTETWTSTALTPSRSRSGLPVTLTWGFVPDGTPVQFEAGGPTVPSDLIASFNAAFNGDPNETDLTKQPWFFVFADSYGKWDQVSGMRFLYEPNNTSQTTGGGTVAGLAGVRPDMRIGGFDLDASDFDADGVLAWNWFPGSGGDMGINTARANDFFNNPSNDYRRAKNTIQHEIGHGINLEHWDADVLMNAFLRLNLNGIQLDEVRAAHFYFGDKYEETNNEQGNQTVALATPLGMLGANGLSVGTDADVPTQQIADDADDFVSISNQQDLDYFSFEIDQPGKVSIDLTPLGGVIDVFDGGDFDANARGNLTMRLVDKDGQTELALINDTGTGGIERIVEYEFDEAGEYYVAVGLRNDTIQMYRLDITLDAILGDLLGDMNGDGALTDADIDAFVQALTDPAGYASAFPDVDPDQLGDFTGDGQLTNSDISGFVDALAATGAAVPEPTSLALLGLGGLLIGRRRRSR